MKVWHKQIVMCALTIAAAVCMAPFAWLLCASVKRGEDLFAYPFLPWTHLDRLTLSNFGLLFRNQPFAAWLTNSAFLASAQTVLVVTLSSLGGFALAKYRFAGKRPLTQTRTAVSA